jgi:hypothetical protein
MSCTSLVAGSMRAYAEEGRRAHIAPPRATRSAVKRPRTGVPKIAARVVS